MAQELSFKDPHQELELALVTVPTADIEVIDHQRRESPPHVAKLAASMERIGFLVPPIAVRREGGEGAPT